MIAPRTSCAAGPTAWGKDTFARATHSAFKGLYARYLCSRATIWYLVYKGRPSAARDDRVLYLTYNLDNALKLVT